jgi:hypothetical protein
VLSELQLRSDRAWKPLRPVTNERGVSRKKNFAHSLIRFRTMAAMSHQRYPTGDVVVCERDLAEQLRKPSDAVAIALNLLLGEQKVQRAPLNGYWKLNG